MGGQRDTFPTIFSFFFHKHKILALGDCLPLLLLFVYCILLSYFPFFLCHNLFTIFSNKIPKYQKVLLSFHYFSIIFLLHLTLFTSFNISTHIFSFSITLLFQHSYFSILPFHHFQHSFHLLSQSIIILSKHSHFFPFQNIHSLSFIS